ncbi:MAG: CPBP family intramembrane glutamic endopeptidase [Acidimicrobiia bacterium]
MSVTPDPASVVLAAVGAYNAIQNLVVPERWYVPANMVVTAGLVAYARRSGVSYTELGLSRGDLGRGLRMGAGMVASTALATTLAAASPRFSQVLLDGRARGHNRADVATQLLLRFPLGTALYEEVAFRGVLKALWTRRSGERTARTVTAAAFGAWHILPTARLYPDMAGGRSESPVGERAAATVAGVAITTVAGLLFDRLRARSGSLVAPWLAHLGFSAVSYVAARRAWLRVG